MKWLRKLFSSSPRSLKYEQFLGKRRNTFAETFRLLNDMQKRPLILVELGSTRSFSNGRIESDPKFYKPNKPKKWDWGAGIFTKVFSDSLAHIDYTLWTVDPSNEALSVASTMVKTPKVKYLNNFSTHFLQNCNFKFDLVYMDHAQLIYT